MTPHEIAAAWEDAALGAALALLLMAVLIAFVIWPSGTRADRWHIEPPGGR